MVEAELLRQRVKVGRACMDAYALRVAATDDDRRAHSALGGIRSEPCGGGDGAERLRRAAYIPPALLHPPPAGGARESKSERERKRRKRR